MGQFEWLLQKEIWGFVLMGKLNMSQQCALPGGRANCILTYIKQGIASWLMEVIAPLCTAVVWPQLKYCVQFWLP